MEIAIESNGRLVIPKGFREMLGLKDTVYMYHDVENNCLCITTKARYSSIELIDKRLKRKDITKSERTFLERLRNTI